MVQRQQDHLATLSEIRSMMERSSRFISLSGLSGVAAGLCALAGAAVVYIYLGTTPFAGERVYYEEALRTSKWGMNYQTFFILDAFLVLIAALASGIFFTSRKAKRKGQQVWDALTLRLLTNLAIPLVAGGIFCLALMYHGLFAFVAPTTLVFYGLALINGSKYTLNDIRYLGILEVILGLVALFKLGYGLEFWVVGFGFLHIIYGMHMYYKYEK